MKRLLVFASALLLAGAAVAADKVIQASAKHMPSWIGGMEEGFIIVSAEDSSLDGAQQKAITQIREQIISAIATRVHSATSITMHEVTDNGSIQSHKEMTQELSVAAADIPYLADVSPSHAADFYWAKIQRKDKSIYYHYHVKYPLSNSKLRLLVEEYEQQQKQINDSLQMFASVDFAAYDDLEQMLLMHSRLKQFASGLREDDSRRDICSQIRQSYERMLDRNLQAVVTDSDRERTYAELRYAQKSIRNSLTPKVSTNCLTAIAITKENNATRISYDYRSGCYEEEQNWLNITYTVLGKKYATRCYIK